VVLRVYFAYGSRSKPYMKMIPPHGLSLPKVPKGGLGQHSDAVEQRAVSHHVYPAVMIPVQLFNGRCRASCIRGLTQYE